jgi:membrane-associated phospholipid phosphatase
LHDEAKLPSELGVKFLHRSHAGITAWWADIADWFRFVHHRRLDLSWPIFPPPLVLAFLVAGIAGATILLALFADPAFLEIVRQEGWRPEGAFKTITELGRSDWFLYPAGIFLIAFSIFRPGGMVSSSQHLAHTLMLAAYFLFTTIAFSGLLANLFKFVIGRQRPEYVDIGHVWMAEAFSHGYRFASFPSGHATTAGAAAIAIALLFPRIRFVVVAIGILVAISRPALGVHFPSDVFAGFCLGGFFSYFYARAFARKRLLFAFDTSGGIFPRFRRNLTRSMRFSASQIDSTENDAP